MKIKYFQDVDAKQVNMEGAEFVSIRWLISEQDGAERFAMRLFELDEKGRTPLHQHEWEHEVFVLDGIGSVWKDGKEVSIPAGTALFVPPEEKHCFVNNGNTPFRFLCLVPIQKKT